MTAMEMDALKSSSAPSSAASISASSPSVTSLHSHLVSALAQYEMDLAILSKHVSFWAKGHCLNMVCQSAPTAEDIQQATQSSFSHEDTRARLFAAWFKPSPQLVSSAGKAAWVRCRLSAATSRKA
jgi:hypothetical protein